MSETLLEFLRMGGYARYVWPPYFFAAAVLGANAYFIRRRLRRALHNAGEKTQ